jgi:hypothetical protein
MPHSLLVELDDPPTTLVVVLGGSMPLKILVIVRSVNRNEGKALAQDDSGIREISKAPEGVQHDSGAIWIPHACNQAVEVGVDPDWPCFFQGYLTPELRGAKSKRFWFPLNE